MRTGAVTAGVPSPLGVWPAKDGVNVAVWSTAAAIDLCLFDNDGGERRIRLPQRTGQVFHGHIAGGGEGCGRQHAGSGSGWWSPHRRQ